MAYPPGFKPPTPYKAPVLPAARTPIQSFPGEVGNTQFANRLPKDAHSIRIMQMGLGVDPIGVAGPKTQAAWMARNQQNDLNKNQQDRENADWYTGSDFEPTSDATRKAVVETSRAELAANPPGASNPGPAVSAVAPPPPLTLMQQAARKTGGALKSVGNTIKNNPMETIAATQGVLGALIYGTAKAPKPLDAPAPYKNNTRGAQGMEATGYEQARQDILTGQETASQATSADASTSVVQRLLAGREAGRALGSLAVQNNGAFQTDQRRVDAEQRQDYDRNYTLQRGFKEGQYNEQKQEHTARRIQGQLMVQAGADSLGAAYQSRQQDKQLALESKNRQGEASIKQLHLDLASAKTEEETELLLGQLEKIDAQGIRTRQARARYGKKAVVSKAGGGKIYTGDLEFKPGRAGKSSASAKGKASSRVPQSPVSVQTFHDMSKDFGNQIAKFGAQASAHFNRSLETAMRLRSTPFGSSTRSK